VKKPRPRPGGKGRFLEVLAALLERTLGTEAEITTPDWLPDRHTGELREVDVALRTRVGSTDVLIIAECRDRSRPQDVRWIEEIASKAVSVGASRAIAVSSSGFTAPAKAKASILGVEVRELRELTSATVAEAFQIGGVTVFRTEVELLAVGTFYTPPDPSSTQIAFDEIRGRQLFVPLFQQPTNGHRCSLARLVEAGLVHLRRQGTDLHEGVPRDGTHVQKHLMLTLEGGEVIATFSDGSSAELIMLSAILELWIDPVALRPLAAHGYHKGAKSLVDTVEFGPSPGSGPPIAFTYHRDTATGREVAAWHIEKQAPSEPLAVSFSHVALKPSEEQWKPWTKPSE
jgi:hypothetical protein